MFSILIVLYSSLNISGCTLLTVCNQNNQNNSYFEITLIYKNAETLFSTSRQTFASNGQLFVLIHVSNLNDSITCIALAGSILLLLLLRSTDLNHKKNITNIRCYR